MYLAPEQNEQAAITKRLLLSFWKGLYATACAIDPSFKNLPMETFNVKRLYRLCKTLFFPKRFYLLSLK